MMKLLVPVLLTGILAIYPYLQGLAIQAYPQGGQSGGHNRVSWGPTGLTFGKQEQFKFGDGEMRDATPQSGGRYNGLQSNSLK